MVGRGCSVPPVQRLSLLLTEPGTGTAVQAVPISMIPSCHPSSCRQEVFVFLRPRERPALCFQQTSESGLSLTSAHLLPHVRNFPHLVLSDILLYSCEAADWLLDSTRFESLCDVTGCQVTTISEPSIRQIRGGLGHRGDKGELSGPGSL